MGTRYWSLLLIGVVCCGFLATTSMSAQGGGTAFDRWYRGDRDRSRPSVDAQGRWDNRRDPRVLRGYQDPAFARGYSDGWDKGADDRRDSDRYDPVRHGDYRDGDDGYSRTYGSKNAYKNNYRAGFRRGYDEGYRNGARYRR